MLFTGAPGRYALPRSTTKLPSSARMRRTSLIISGELAQVGDCGSPVHALKKLLVVVDGNVLGPFTQQRDQNSLGNVCCIVAAVDKRRGRDEHSDFAVDHHSRVFGGNSVGDDDLPLHNTRFGG